MKGVPLRAVIERGDDGFRVCIYRGKKPLFWMTRTTPMKHSLKSQWAHLARGIQTIELEDTTCTKRGGDDSAKRSTAAIEGWAQWRIENP